MRFDNIRLNEAYWMMEHFSAVLVDVREEDEYQRFHLKGAINIPYDKIGDKKLNKNTAYIFYCDNGIQSMRAARDCAMEGFHVYNIIGGLKGNEKDIDIM